MKDISRMRVVLGQMAAGANIFFDHQGDTIIDSIILYKSKNKIKCKSALRFKTLTEFAKAVPDSIPAYISLDGKHVIHKIIENSVSGDELDNVLPNANRNDFILQKTEIGLNKRLISVIRKDKYEGYINEMAGLDRFVFDISLGPVNSFGVISHLIQSGAYQIPHYNVICSEGVIVDVRKTDDLSESKEFSFENDTLNINSLVPFANGIRHFKKTNEIIPDLPIIQDNRKKFAFKKLFKICGWFILSFLFSSLLINFLLFGAFRNKNQILISQIDSNKELLKIVQQKQNLLKSKEELFSITLYTKEPLFAYYADRISSEVPPEILLNRMEIFPPERQTLAEISFNF